MRIKFNPISWILFFELFVCIPYSYVTVRTSVQVIFKYMRLLLIFLELSYLLLTFLLKNGGVWKINRKILQSKLAGIAVVAYAFVVFIITLKNTDNFTWVLNQFTPYVLAVLAIYRSAQQSVVDSLKGIAYFFWVAICLNCLTVLICGERGLYVSYTDVNVHFCYLLGVDNQFGKYYFPGLALIWFYEEYTHQKKQILTYSALAMAMLSYFILLNGTGSIVVVMFLGLFILYKLKTFDRFLNLPLFAGIILFLVLNIFFEKGILYGDSPLMKMIVSYTGKDVTFSGRTHIWEAAVDKFWISPLFGYGKQVGDYMVEWGPGRFSCHNVFLQTLLEIGALGTVFFLFPFLIAAMQSFQIVKENRCIRTLYIGIFCTSLYFMFEVGTLIPLFVIILVLAICSVKFRQKSPLQMTGESHG